MRKLVNWFKNNRDAVVRNSFLIPILLVVIMSISHVVSWYDLGNPFSWAIYLSVAIEVFALASVSAASINVSRASIWFLFGLVTFIQIVGNIFFEYRDINLNDPSFLSWVELIQPAFVDWDLTDHRRLLATIQGGTLPLMSLTALHYYIKFTDKQKAKEVMDDLNNTGPSITEVAEKEDEFVEEIKETVDEDEVRKKFKLEHPEAEFNDNGELDVSATLENTLQDELDQAAADEEIDEILEELDQPSKEGTVKVEPVALGTEENKELSDNLEELSDKDGQEEEQPEDTKNLNKSEYKDNGDDENFGPPHINNGNVT